VLYGSPGLILGSSSGLMNDLTKISTPHYPDINIKMADNVDAADFKKMPSS